MKLLTTLFVLFFTISLTAQEIVDSEYFPGWCKQRVKNYTWNPEKGSI